MRRNAITLGVVATFDREDLGPLASESYCYLTTTGRVSAEPREIEIWFGLEGETLYLLSGGGDRSDWVKNLTKTPDVSVRIGEQTFQGRARRASDSDEDALARRLLFEKYSPTYSGDLKDWRDTALPIAVDLDLGRDRDRVDSGRKRI
jgi:deazaflavin-dependent oxidoreductase (nitroreductase family)